MPALLIAVAVCFLLTGLLLARWKRPVAPWAAAYTAASGLAFGALTLEQFPTAALPLNLTPALLSALTNLLLLGLLAALTFSYLGRSRPYLPLAIASMLIVILIGAAASGIDLGFTAPTWWDSLFTAPAVLPIALLAIAVLALVTLYGMVTLRFFATRIPLLANRLLWWLLAVPSLTVGDAFLLQLSQPLFNLGIILRLLGLIALAYAIGSANPLEIRYIGRRTLSSLLMVFITAAFLLAGAGGAVLLLSRFPDAEAPLYILLLTLALAIAYLIVRQFASRIIDQIILLTDYDSTRFIAEFSQRTASLLEIEQLTEEIADLLAEAVDASGILLIVSTPVGDEILAEPYAPAEQPIPTPHAFAANSAFVAHLQRTGAPVLQYNLDVDPQFSSLPAKDRRWLQSLHMDAYLPLFDEGQFTGLLAIGPRASGDAYRPRELQLFTAIANQTAVALKNARLYSQQRELNAEMQVLNENLSITNARLTQLDAVKTDFITIASHELRTPLTHLRGYTEILSMFAADSQLGTDAQFNDILKSMINACERLDDVIGKMLDVSQMDVKAVQLYLTNTAFEPLVRRAVEPLIPVIQQRNLQFGIHPMANLPTLSADADRVIQALRHVIGNAIKFTPDGGRIEVAARHVLPDDLQAEGIELVIRDSGVGVDPAHHDLIFEKFYRTGNVNVHSTSNTNFMGAGPGLGLTIARGVVLAHGGKIWVESPGYDPQKFPGSTFHLFFPLRPPVTLPEAVRSDAALAFLEDLTPTATARPADLG